MSIVCYDQENGVVVGMVEFQDNLDTWDGHNFSCGGTGHHMGIGKTNGGKFYICQSSQFVGVKDYAYIISAKEAKMLCMEHNQDIYEELFEETLELI